MLEPGNDGPDLEAVIPFVFCGCLTFLLSLMVSRRDPPSAISLATWWLGLMCIVLWLIGMLGPILTLLDPMNRERFRIRDVLGWIILGSIAFGPTFVRLYLL
jgi:hypothetical protein